MSAESGIPTYRGKGGVWHMYNWEEYACQKAFDKTPLKVIDFHKIRRKTIANCEPHQGHKFLTDLQNSRDGISIITQNIDGMHQKAGTKNVIELHGSLWRLRCENCGNEFEDYGKKYKKLFCDCENQLRPDIVWFGDQLDFK